MIQMNPSDPSNICLNTIITQIHSFCLPFDIGHICKNHQPGNSKQKKNYPH